MPIITEGKYPSDVLKYESLNDFTRETVIIAAGSGALDVGAVLGITTATGKWSYATVAVTGGLEVARAVLLEKCDATAVDKKAIVARRGPAKVNSNVLTFGPTFTTQAQRDAGAAQLEANSQIIARRGA